MAELPFSLFNSAEPSLLTLTEALESVEEEDFLTLLDDDEEDESVLFLELPHAARVNKARTESYDRYFKTFSSVVRLLFVIIKENKCRCIMYQTTIKGDKYYHSLSEDYGVSVELFGYTD